MSNKIYLPNGMEAYQAQYNTTYVPEYDSNPFIQALPPIANKEEIVRKLVLKPTFNEEERKLDSYIRLQIVQRLYKLFLPLPKHVEIWNMISTLIRQGYQARNPYDKDYVKYINETGKQIVNKTFDISAGINFRTTASCGMILGVSGMGKTITVNRILNNLNQIIVHNQYKGEHFNNIQLTWLKLEAPYNGSLKSLTHQFFAKTDELLGSNNFKKYVSRNLSIDSMLPLMGKVSQNIGLGLLVLDELQNLRNGKSNQLMNYFVSLINSFGVPILYIGTPASHQLLENEFRIARRFTGYGKIIWNNMENDSEFRLFIQGIWKYQWTKKFTALTEEIINVFYEETQGISDLIIKLFLNCQHTAILKGNEEITVNMIRKVAKEQFMLMTEMLEAMKSGNPYRIAKYEDIKRIDNFKERTIDIVQQPLIVKEKKETQTGKETDSIQSKEKVGQVKKIENENGDLRLLVQEGKRNNLSAYEALLKSGQIDDMSFWLEIGGAFKE